MAADMPIMRHTCRYCGWDMITKSNLEYHQRICLLSGRNNQDICNICAKSFNTNKEIKFHLRKCGKYLCYQCDIPFLTTSALNTHISSYHRINANKISKTYKCSNCNKICNSRRELYAHRIIQHGGNNTEDFDDDDLPEYMKNEENDNIREVYSTNRNHIMANHQRGELRHIHNFTTNNLDEGYTEIRRHLNEIYDDLDVTYRINFAFGMILFNSQTGEYRYYIPYFNSRILTYPFTITNRNSIRLLMNKIHRIDIIEQACAVRPSTAWTLAFITNVQYHVFLTDFPQELFLISLLTLKVINI